MPDLPFPDGRDLLQLVWCPLIHPQDHAGAALPKLYWRTEADVLAAGVLRDVPTPREGEYEEDFPPALRQTLQPRIEELEERLGMEYTQLACALQTKVNGYPAWHQPPDWPSCEAGHRCPESPYMHRYQC
ncbi:hypothetical protein [Streptomyces sp. NPDC002328]|uniref:hypothetical protein n=1 Tax=Streptomyces sp. NPDC002328 TaxID=3364642 RepID=UPI00369117A1